MSQSFPALQFLRGPYSNIGTVKIYWAQPIDAYVLDNSGNDYALLYLGNKDATANLLVGGGFQLVSGQPTFFAPQGAAVWDTLDNCLWVSDGTGVWTVSTDHVIIQVVQGQPNFLAAQGYPVWDSVSKTLFVSNGDLTWTQISGSGGGGGSQGLDMGSLW